jgi:adenylyltransferase/sulfurtransferase
MTPASAPLESIKALVVGVGGLGCPASAALAVAGVRRFTLVDPDCVELANLHRQPWHRTPGIGRPKVLSARAGLVAAFPDAQVEVLEGRLDAGNAESLFRAHDLVIDATDQILAKFLLSDVAVLTGVPLVYGGVVRLEGQAMRVRKGGPCLRCLFESPPPDDVVPRCAQVGVLGPVAGYVGALQALLGLEWLRGEAAAGDREALRIFDAAALTQRTIQVRRAPDCPACKGAC